MARTRSTTQSAESGFTLMEITLALGMLAIVSGIVAIVGLDGYRTLQITRVYQEIYDESLRATEVVSDLVASGQLVLPLYVSTEPQTYLTTETALILELPAYDGSGERLVNLVDIIVIQQNPTTTNQLEIHTFAAPGSNRPSGRRVATSHLTELEFRYFAQDGSDADLVDDELTDPAQFATADRVYVTLTTTASTNGITPTVRLSGTSRLRN